MTRLALSLALASSLLACAQGGTDPGVARDNCLRRDCGVAIGGAEVEPEDSAFEDEGLPVDEDTAPASDSPPSDSPPSDSAAPKDTAPATDTAPADTASDGGCTPPSGVACTTFPQCGCASSLACDVTSVDGRTSCVSRGTGTLNQRCTGLGQCAAGFSCVYGVCQPFCGSSTDCSGTGTPTCRNVQYVDSTATPAVTKDIPGFRVCMKQCNPLNPSTVCGSSTTCLFTSATTTTCAGATTSTTAGSCAADAFACAPGYVCVGTGDCRRWCRIGFAGDCPTGKTCGKLTTAPTIAGIEYGVCTY